VARPTAQDQLVFLGTPNGGSGGPVDLGGDGSIGLYDGGGVATLGLLLWGHWRRRRAGAQRGGALLFPMRCHRIKWRIEAKIVLVSGLAILPLSVSLLLASVFFSNELMWPYSRLEH
jgi:hypothetical protein